MALVSLRPSFRLPSGHTTPLPDSRRSDPIRLGRDVAAARRSPVVQALIEASDSILLVLNEHREIVAFNDAAVQAAGPADLHGQRQGEALRCMNAQGEGGCGAAPACATCGGLGAVVGAQESGRSTEAECLVRSVASAGGNSHEFNVRATPISVDGARFTAVSLRDLSGEKRRDALEQAFLHDVLNTLAGLRGWTTLLRAGRGDAARATERVDFLTRQVEREIRDHRDLVLAETGALVPSPTLAVCNEILGDVEAVFSCHAAARDRKLVVESSPPDLSLEVDVSLLLRVLVNMVRNALEATPAGGMVSARALREPFGRHGAEGVRFEVRNEGAMPAEVQHRVFVRSFSTKAGRGRGLGTYSMKLLGERFLGGQVAFRSTPEAGTTFWIDLPARAGG
jgi:signal transduction histidine kinase